MDEQHKEDGELALAVYSHVDGLLVALVNCDPAGGAGDYHQAAAFWTAVGHRQVLSEREPGSFPAGDGPSGMHHPLAAIGVGEPRAVQEISNAVAGAIGVVPGAACTVLLDGEM